MAHVAAVSGMMPQATATIRHSQIGSIVLLTVVGRIGPRSAIELRRELHRLLLHGERRIVIDLSAAVFDGPSGAVVVILARRVMRAHGGTITLMEPDEQREHDPFRAVLRDIANDAQAIPRSVRDRCDRD